MVAPQDNIVGPDLKNGPVIKILSDLRDHPRLFYMPQPGNAGDAVISVGFFDLARSLGLNYRIANRNTPLGNDDTLIMAGGGGFAVRGGETPAALERYATRVGRLIMLPQTVLGHDEILRALGSNVTLILRERKSYEHAVAMCRDATVMLDHDMAFHADLRALLRRRGLRGLRLSRRRLGRLGELIKLRRRSRSMRHLDVFRTDRGGSGNFQPTAATDISMLATFGVRTEAACYLSASQLAKTINAFDEISTDRLHVAIVSGRLGKRTVLYDNNYWKCRAVYEHSLRSYDNIEMAAPVVAEN